MVKQPNIDEDFIDYNTNVGPLQLIMSGYPGSGKSNHASSIIAKSIQRTKELAIMHGDIGTEWRHYLNFSKYLTGIILLIPTQIKNDLTFITNDIVSNSFPSEIKENYKVKLEIKYIDFEKFQITDYFKENWLTVLYDGCFIDETRTQLWEQIAKQLIFRTKFYNNTMTYLCHEAHKIYPQTASSKQWKAIIRFVMYFGEFRKRLIRSVLLTHSETDVFDMVRKRCYWKVYRDAFPTNPRHRKIVKEYVFNMAIHKYHVFKGELYAPLQQNEKMKEIKNQWLMLPRDLIKLNWGTDPKTTSKRNYSDLVMKMVVNSYNLYQSKRKTAEKLGIDYGTVDRYLKMAQKVGFAGNMHDSEPIMA